MQIKIITNYIFSGLKCFRDFMVCHLQGGVSLNQNLYSILPPQAVHSENSEQGAVAIARFITATTSRKILDKKGNWYVIRVGLKRQLSLKTKGKTV